MKIFIRNAFLLSLFLSACAFIQAQSKVCSPNFTVAALPAYTEENTENKNIVEPYDGTFQFIFTKGLKQVFTDDIVKVINQNRKEREEVTIALSEYCKLRILSGNQIRSPQFIPLTKSYIFKTE